MLLLFVIGPVVWQALDALLVYFVIVKYSVWHQHHFYVFQLMLEPHLNLVSLFNSNDQKTWMTDRQDIFGLYMRNEELTWIFSFTLYRFLRFCSIRLLAKHWFNFKAFFFYCGFSDWFTFDFVGLFATTAGGCISTGSMFTSTALLAINFVVHNCFISCKTCSSTPSSKNESRTPAITSSMTAWYSLSWNSINNPLNKTMCAGHSPFPYSKFHWQWTEEKYVKQIYHTHHCCLTRSHFLRILCKANAINQMRIPKITIENQ